MSCSSDEQSDKECPLCMELLEIDDVDFYPCKCEYQICRFCWHRLKNDENGLCPACRQPYPEDPVNFKPLSSADLQRIKDEKKLKAQAEKMRISESRKHLANYRVLQKNLLYVVGLSTRFANEEVLRKPEFFGKFGKILKIVLGTSPATNLPAHLQPSHTAYITYNKVDEALKAIQGVNNSILDGRTIKASLGTTKYCSSFLRSQTCGKPECMYLHDTADNDISFTKEDMHAGKHSDYERRLIEAMISKRQALERRQAANPNCKADQNGVDIDDTQDLNDDIEANGLSSGSPTSDRQDSLDNENRDLERPSKKITPPSRRHSPPTTDPDSSYSSMNGESSSEPQKLDRDISNERVSLEAPPGLIAPPGLTHSSSTRSISENTSKLLRFMNLTEGSETGWVPAPAPQEEAPAPLANWQTLLGLTPSEPKKSQVSKRTLSPTLGLSDLLDDDLGFDPFSESTKGLAALLEEERVDRHRNPQNMLSSQRQQSVGHRSLSDLWGVPSLGSATNGVQQSRSHTSFSGAPFDMFGLNSSTNHMATNYSNGYHPPVPSMYSDYPQNHQQQQAQQQYALHKQMSNFAPPPGLTAPRQQQAQPQSIAEWQEGLKALLPNVNVRFSSDFEQQANQRWSGMQQPNGYTMHQMMSHQHHHSVPPPPGFSIQNR